MQDEEFEWDDNKAVQNEAVHHVSFDVAREALTERIAFHCLEWHRDG
jgi:uncharacterized DUF497 family protein